MTGYSIKNTNTTNGRMYFTVSVISSELLSNMIVSQTEYTRIPIKWISSVYKIIKLVCIESILLSPNFSVCATLKFYTKLFTEKTDYNVTLHYLK